MLDIEVNDLEWDVICDVAHEVFYIQGDYIDTPNKIAKKPAFALLYLDGSWWLLMDRICKWQFKSKKQAYKKLQEIANSAKVPIRILLKTKRGYKVIAEKVR